MTKLDYVQATVAGSRRPFPNFLLAAHDGRQVRFYDDLVRGRLVLVSFAYTNCEGSCPASLAVLFATRRLLARKLGRAPDLVTITLDPLRDTVPALAHYVAAHGSPPGWTCVTGPAGSLETLRRYLGFYDPDPRVDADRTQHAALVAIGDDRRGRWQMASTRASAPELAKLALRASGVAI